MVSASEFLGPEGESIRWAALATTLVGGVLWATYRIVISTWLGVGEAFSAILGGIEGFLVGAVEWYGRIATYDFQIAGALGEFSILGVLVGLLIVLATAYVVAWGWNAYA